MANGTYSGSYSSVTLGPIYLDVTFALGAEVSDSKGDAVAGGTLAAYTIFNEGSIHATATGSVGIHLFDGGMVTNDGLIGGYANGILMTGAPGIVYNQGTISDVAPAGSGVELDAGGTIVNGTTDNHTALITGSFGITSGTASANVTVVNHGQIKPEYTGVFGSQKAGIDLLDGGTVINGVAGQNYAFISDLEIEGAAGSVTNYGQIWYGVSLLDGGHFANKGTSSAIHYGGVFAANASAMVTNDGQIASAVDLAAGGKITNGSPDNQSAFMNVAMVSGGSGSIENYGTIGHGISVVGHGNVDNGSTTDLNARVGAYGVEIDGGGTFTNFGTVDGVIGYGVKMGDGGTIQNGTTADKTALILSLEHTGIDIAKAAGVVRNFGTIMPSGTIAINPIAVLLEAGGSVVNGGATDTIALIEGYRIGVEVEGAAGTIKNFGTIAGTYYRGNGAYLTKGGTVVNGSTADTTAVIRSGGTDVLINGGIGTVQNFGTIGSVILEAGGLVTNGGATDAAATITGLQIIAGEGTIQNFGSLGFANLVSGTITNGDESHGSAVIGGIQVTAGSILNFGTITGEAVIDNIGGVVNGSTADRSAFIAGVLLLGQSDTVTNFGTIASTFGVDQFGMFAGAVSNYGTIESTTLFALSLATGGTIVNGATDGATALIAGGSGITFGTGAGTLTNFGTIDATASAGVYLRSGTITNESGGTIIGTTGIVFGVGGVDTLVNDGVVGSTRGTGGIALQFQLGDQVLVEEGSGSLVGGISGFQVGDTIDLAGVSYSNVSYSFTDGTLAILQNGSTADTFAMIGVSGNDTFALAGDGASGTDMVLKAPPHIPGTYDSVYNSITLGTSPATLTADGTVYSTAAGIGVYGSAAGQIFDNFGFISASVGVELNGVGTIDNAGTIIGNTAVQLNTGTVINSGLMEGGLKLDQADWLINETSGTIVGDTGDTFSGVNVENLGTIRTTNNIPVLSGGGTIINGSTVDTTALIQGPTGIGWTPGNGTIVNYGTIQGTGTRSGSSGVGVNGSAPNSVLLINGSQSDTVALIQGYSGAGVYKGSLVNFGTIVGSVTYSGPFVGEGRHGSVGASIVAGSLTNGNLDDSAATIEGYSTGVLAGGFNNMAGAVLNFGTIKSLYDRGGIGLAAYSGSTITNGTTDQTTALIQGADDGIRSDATATHIQNFGTIRGGEGTHSGPGAGIALAGGGTITNGSAADTSALIIGVEGIAGYTNGLSGQSSSAATVINFGSIEAGLGIYLPHGGIITNEATGLIEGFYAVKFRSNSAVTVINDGTIKSDGSVAVIMIDSGGRLVDDPGAVIIGTVVSNATDTFELASSASIGTISGLGVSFSGFGTIDVDSNARWVLSGSNTVSSGETLTSSGTLGLSGQLTIAIGGSLVNDGLIKVNSGVFIDYTSLSGAGTIAITNSGTVELLGGASGTVDFYDGSTLELSNPTSMTIGDFAKGDTIALAGVTYSASNTVTYNAGLHEIIVYGAGNTTLATLDVSNVTLDAGQSLTVVADGTISAIEVVCFLEGTRLRTDRGEVAVEALSEGDLVVTESGTLEPVRWIGKRRMNARRHPSPEKVYPVRINRNAFADGVPVRDLLVSPGHAIFANGVLIPAHRLINGVTIFQDFEIVEPNYFHIELDRHDVLLAEGLAAESYLDSGNRGFFENGGRPIELFALPDGSRRARGRCAPLKNGGPEASAVKQALLQRVRAMGHVAGRRPDLRLEIDGRVVLPVSVKRRTYRFELPLHYEAVRLVSQTAIGGSTRPGNFDARRLGVAVLDVMHDAEPIDLRSLNDGWHRVEREGGKRFRWTDGKALLPVAGPGTLEIRLLRPVERWIRQVDLVKLRRA